MIYSVGNLQLSAYIFNPRDSVENSRENRTAAQYGHGTRPSA